MTQYDVEQTRNFFFGDCIKDWFELYDPLPACEQPQELLRAKATAKQNIFNTITTVFNKLTTDEQLVRLNNKFENKDWSCNIDLVFHSSLLKHLPCYATVSKDIEWIACSCRLTTKKMSYIRQQYEEARRLVFRHTLASTLLLPFDKIETLDCIINFDLQQLHLSKPRTLNVEDTVSQLLRARSWLTRLRSEGQEWNINSDFPPNCLMMPNTSLSYVDQYTKRREELAWRWQEVSLMYFVGEKTRADLHRNGIYTTNHPRFLEALSSCDFNKYDVQKNMLCSMYQAVPRYDIEWCYDYQKTKHQGSKFAYLDLESTNNLGPEPCINMVGILYYDETQGKVIYKSFTSKDGQAKQDAIVFISSKLQEFTIVHYTAADKPAIPVGHKTLDLYSIVTTNFLTSSKLQNLHLNKFKLKTIYKRICERCNFPNFYSYCQVTDGMQAWIALEKFITNDSTEDLDNVLLYNEVDCFALWLLHAYLEDQWTVELLSYILSFQTSKILIGIANKEQEDESFSTSTKISSPQAVYSSYTW